MYINQGLISKLKMWSASFIILLSHCHTLMPAIKPQHKYLRQLSVVILTEKYNKIKRDYVKTLKIFKQTIYN